MSSRPTGPNVVYRGPGGPTGPSGPGGSGPGAWPRPPRRRRRALGPQLLELLAILLFLFLVYEGVLWFLDRTSPKEVTIPKVVGFKQDEAISVLRSAGLQTEIVAERADEKVAEGIVLVAEPEGGRVVKAGRVIRLTLSSGSRWTKVPDVQSMSLDRAKALIRNAKLTISKESANFDRKVPMGYVIWQNPRPGTRVPRNSGISLMESRGPVPEESPGVEDTGEPKPDHATKRRYEIEFVVPPGPTLQEVKIVVRDEKGDREVYRRNHQVGETIRKTVSGTGTEISVEVYVSGNLAEQHPF